MKKTLSSGSSKLGRPLKKARRLMAWLVFLDESGFLLAPLVRRRWEPCGQTPVLYQRGRHHKKVSAMAALCVSPQRDQVRLYFCLYPGRDMDSPWVIAFLKALDRELETNWCLVWDRLNAHRAKTTTAWLVTAPQLRTFFFSSYAPELNPVEYLWSWSKTNPLANRAIHEVDQLAIVARNVTRSRQNHEHLLRSSIRHSPFSVRLK